MDPVPQSQTSFIPRKPVVREPINRERPTSILFVAATIVFVVALLGSGAVYAYRLVLQRQIDASAAYLDQNRTGLEPETINRLITVDRQLRSAKLVLEKHVAVTPIFSFLEQKTLKTVQLKSFDYQATDKGGTLRLSGEALGYESAALQSNTFNQATQLVRDAVFSNLNLNDRGAVVFDASITLDPDLTSYKKQEELTTEIP